MLYMTAGSLFLCICQHVLLITIACVLVYYTVINRCVDNSVQAQYIVLFLLFYVLLMVICGATYVSLCIYVVLVCSCWASLCLLLLRLALYDMLHIRHTRYISDCQQGDVDNYLLLFN